MGLLPREGKFCDLFNQHADLAANAAVELEALLADLSQLELRSRTIAKNEKQADRITHETVPLLHKSFITPLDRDEIHQLSTRMGDILDLREDVATCIFLCDVEAVTPDAQKLAEICGDIDRLESEADFAFRSALAKLVREESDARAILKLKEVYQLQTITDKAEDAANVIEGMVLENA